MSDASTARRSLLLCPTPGVATARNDAADSIPAPVSHVLPVKNFSEPRPRTVSVLILLLTGLLLFGGRPGAAQTSRSRPRVLIDPTLPVAPPSVQNYLRYSPDDQREFSTAGFQYPPFALPAPPARPRQMRPGAVVFGWHPYWMSNAYINYDFSLLTHVAYYGYQVNDLGELLLPAPPGQGPDSLLARARRHNAACKVLLSIAYPAAEGVGSLLDPTRTAAQERLLSAIVREVVATKADGVNLDFCPPDQKPQLLSQLGQQLQHQADTLRTRQRRLSAAGRQLQQQRDQLAPQPDSLLLLADQLDALTAQAQQTSQQQQTLDQQIAVHHQQVPKAPPSPGLIWGGIVTFLDLDREAKAQLAKARAAYGRVEQRLTDQKMVLNTQEARIRQLLQLNARLTRNYAARQANRQPALAANEQQLALNQAAQADTKALRGRKQQARQEVQRRASTYQYVVPASMQPLTDHSQPLQDFLGRLALRLWAQDPDLLITLNVPAVDSTGTYRNLRAVQKVVSLFILKAFDYTPYNQIVPGALAPLNPSETWGPHSISTSVAYYLKEGTVPRKQLVVGFPHLAKVWQVDSLGNEVVGDLSAPVYWTNHQLRPQLPEEPAKLDLSSLSRTTSSLAPTAFGRPAPQAWWEDAASLAPKYAWVQEQQLAGVGIWALGYDDGSAQPWKLLRATFTVPVKVLKPVAGPPLSLLERLQAIRHVLVLSAVILIGFLLAGLVVALIRRADSLVPNPPLLSMVGLLIGLCALCIAGYLYWFGQLVPSRLGLVVLAAALLTLLLLLYRRYWRRQILP